MSRLVQDRDIVTRRIVPPRVATPLDAHPPGLGTEHQSKAWHRACREQASASRFRYSVAPMCRVPTPRGVIEAGGEVTREDVGGWAPLQVLLRRMVLVENPSATSTPAP